MFEINSSGQTISNKKSFLFILRGKKIVLIESYTTFKSFSGMTKKILTHMRVNRLVEYSNGLQSLVADL